MNVAEEVPPWLGLEEKVENLRGTKALIKDTVRRIVRDKDVKIPGDVLFSNSGSPGNGAYDHPVTILHRILQYRDARRFELLDNAVGQIQVKRQLMVARDKDFPFSRQCREPPDEIIVLSAQQVIFHGVTGADHYVCLLRHLQGSMMAVGVGEGEDLMCFYSIYKYMGLNV